MSDTTTTSWRELPFEAALVSLESLHAAMLADPAGHDLEALRAAHPDHQEATLAFIRGLLAPNAARREAPPPTTPPTPSALPPAAAFAAPRGIHPGLFEMMPVLLMWLDTTHAAALFDQILFDTDHPALYHALVSGLRLAFAPAQVEAAIVARVTGDAPRERANARELAYLVYGGRADYQLSETGRAALAGA